MRKEEANSSEEKNGMGNVFLKYPSGAIPELYDP